MGVFWVFFFWLWVCCFFGLFFFSSGGFGVWVFLSVVFILLIGLFGLFFLTPYIFRIPAFADSTFVSYGELSVLFFNPPFIVFGKNRTKNILTTVRDLENYLLLIFPLQFILVTESQFCNLRLVPVMCGGI